MVRPLQDIMASIVRLSASDTTVLIHGTSAADNECAADVLHAHSPRHTRPYVKVRCAAARSSTASVPAPSAEMLLTSELFGYEEGAFPGATTRQRGRFELAHTGTIFLDEVGALPLQVQKRLLRVLYHRDMERLGGSTAILVDVRVIATTTDDVTRAIAEGRFREDLYERLNVIALNLPPLWGAGALRPTMHGPWGVGLP